MQTANDNHAKYSEEHKAWVESHTPEQIRDANIARTRLHKLAKITTADGKKRSISSLPVRLIKDERRPRKPLTGYLTYSTRRNASGDFDGVPVVERARKVAEEWKALSSEEVQVCVLRVRVTAMLE